MSLKTLMSRITRRGNRPSFRTDRKLADARTDAAVKRQRQRDKIHQDYRSDGGIAPGGF